MVGSPDMLIEEDDEFEEDRSIITVKPSKKTIRPPQKKRSRTAAAAAAAAGKSEKSKEEMERERDEAIRAKYPKLDDIVFKAHDTSRFDNRGVFGIGESPNFRAQTKSVSPDTKTPLQGK